ncbi:hypothetical protein K9L63_00365 [Candidatus Gracilibacteria bacterium]|nr:hypothetical protein [Candidatus Gracilibacteria bacterium]
MIFLKKHHPTHKKYSSIALLFALIPALIWLDMMYALFREYILIPLYYSLPDSAYVTVMLVFPVIALVFATIGHLQTPKKTRDYGLGVMVLSIILVILMALAFSPLREG